MILRDAFAISVKEASGYEFEIRNYLSKLWCLLIEEEDERLRRGSIKPNIDSERIKEMISFIQDNYAKKLELKDIADSASLSKRECFRCFKRSLNMTPFEYLTSHRIQAACKMLSRTSESVTNIGAACGFSSDSYFGKTFKKNMNCTPKEFRRKYPWDRDGMGMKQGTC